MPDEDILASIRAKYPVYAKVPDADLARGIASKYPVYAPYLARYLTANATPPQDTVAEIAQQHREAGLGQEQIDATQPSGIEALSNVAKVTGQNFLKPLSSQAGLPSASEAYEKNVPQGAGPVGKFARGVGANVAGAADFVQSPAGLMSLPAGALPKVAAVAGTVLGGQALAGGAGRLGTAIGEEDPEAAGRAAGEMGLGVLMAAGGRGANRRVVDPQTGTVVRKNPRAAPEDQAAAAEKLAAMEDKPPTPVNEELPVSKTDESGIQLSPDAGPAEALHEVEHVLADQGKGPEPVEGAGAKKYSLERAEPATQLKPYYDYDSQQWKEGNLDHPSNQVEMTAALQQRSRDSGLSAEGFRFGANGRPVPAAKLRDGSVVRGEKGHIDLAEVLDKQGKIGDVVSTGWEFGGEFLTDEEMAQHPALSRDKYGMGRAEGIPGSKVAKPPAPDVPADMGTVGAQANLRAEPISGALGNAAADLGGQPGKIAPEMSQQTMRASASEPVIRSYVDMVRAGKITHNPRLPPGEQIIAALADGRLKTGDYQKILDTHGISDADFQTNFGLKYSDAGVALRHLSEAQRELSGRMFKAGQEAREPIYDSIVLNLKKLTSGKTRSEFEAEQLTKDVVDAFRLNLFALTSFSLDLAGNMSELTAQVGGAVGRDAYNAARGNPTIPSIRGWYRSITRGGVKGKGLSEKMLSDLGSSTVSGEILPGMSFKGKGAFTSRKNLASSVADYGPGLPLYLKSIVDTSSKRLSASATIWRDALEAAKAKKIPSSEREAFVDEFFKNPPKATLADALGEGQKAGYDVPLTKMEQAYAHSTAVRLTMDVFGRWPWQATRRVGEWLGANPAIYRKMKAGTLTGPEFSQYLGKTATGWGGVVLVSNALYDRTDFKSMEYVQEDGDRVRLSSRFPIPEILALTALVKGDKSKVLAALPYVSVPGASLAAGRGGIVGGILDITQRGAKTASIDARGMEREITDLINRSIPGQAVMSALKTVLDPVKRQGVGGEIPFLSKYKKARRDSVSGEEMVPRQEIFGANIPAIGGTPISGAARKVDPVGVFLAKINRIIYRGPRQPVAGMPAADIPPETRDEWEAEFGRERERLLMPLIGQVEAKGKNRLNLSDPTTYENVRAKAGKLESMAAKIATARINERYDKRGKPRRKSTREERTAPEAYKRPAPEEPVQ